jgi:hypothetical protein
MQPVTISLIVGICALALSIINFMYQRFDRNATLLDEKRRRAPFLSATFAVAVGPNEGTFTFTSVIKNSGLNPAADISGRILPALDMEMSTMKMESRVQTPALPIYNANGLPTGASFEVSFSFPLGHMPRQGVLIELLFSDGLTGESASAKYGYRWGGSDQSGSIEPMSRDQLDKLADYLNGYVEVPAQVLR